MMRVLGIVPARGGSKRVPRKNLRVLGGKPLVAWAIEAARGAPSIGRVVVSSDDDEVLALAASIDERLPLRRPAAIAGDRALAIEYVRHALASLEVDEVRFDAVVIVQPSSPFTRVPDIEATLELLARSGAPSAASVVKLDHAIHPSKLKRLVGDRLVPYLEEEHGQTAAHELPELYVRNGAVYAATRTSIDEGRIVADDCRAHVMPRERSLDINDEFDMAIAEVLLSRSSAP